MSRYKQKNYHEEFILQNHKVLKDLVLLFLHLADNYHAPFAGYLVVVAGVVAGI